MRDTDDWFAGPDPAWRHIRVALVTGIHSAATPDRSDRLFPSADGFGLAHGSAGVIFALHRAGASVPEEYVRWTARAVERSADRSPGLYHGPHGAAVVFDTIGRRDAALAAFELARRGDIRPVSDTLATGLTGRALNLLHFARVLGSDALAADGLRLATGLGRRVTAGSARLPGRGLLRGPSGPALLLVRAFELTGEAHFLDTARQALDQDLAAGAGRRPYLDGGSGGVALVLHEYLRHRDDYDLWPALNTIRRACATGLIRRSGLFAGRAGLVAVLVRLGRDADRPAVARHIRWLGRHALLRDGGLLFPGDRLSRPSLDLATGSAGVLLALRAAFGGDTAVLPHLSVARWSGPRPPDPPTADESHNGD
jgi:hypothetical protein